MDYDLHDLLNKLGISELQAQNHLHWYYADSKRPDLGGHAEARLEQDGRYLEVDLYHRLYDVDEDDEMLETGALAYSERVETVRIRARRVGDSEMYRITQLSFDGTDYAPDDDAMLQLASGLFYARALHINEIMINQHFKTANTSSVFDRKTKVAESFNDVTADMGVIIPFRPRKEAYAQRA